MYLNLYLLYLNGNKIKKTQVKQQQKSIEIKDTNVTKNILS